MSSRIISYHWFYSSLNEKTKYQMLKNHDPKHEIEVIKLLFHN